MEKNYKRVPFDIELAKKITKGEVKGHILCENGVYARVVEFNMAGCSDIVVVRRTKECSIEWCYPYKSNGHTITDDHPEYNLFIEIWEETPKHEFKPFDKVLVRDACCEVWRPDIFSSMAYGPLYSCLISDWHYCIPFEGNEHLVGTTKNPE